MPVKSIDTQPISIAFYYHRRVAKSLRAQIIGTEYQQDEGVKKSFPQKHSTQGLKRQSAIYIFLRIAAPYRCPIA